VLCMRELFKSVIQDGNVTDEERAILQNTATLLQQVHDKIPNTKVDFTPKDQFEDLRRKQIEHLRPFMGKVAGELRQHEEARAQTDGQEVEAILDLCRVPWGDGITADELLSCCLPTAEFTGWLKPVWDALLPSRYMFKSRVLELFEYYKVELQMVAVTEPPDPTSPLHRRYSKTARRSMHVLRQGPFWPAVRLYGTAFLFARGKELLELLVVLLKIRVILCIASSFWLVGWLLHPVVYVATRVLDWSEDHWLLGCMCTDSSRNLSVISWIPAMIAALLIEVFTAAVAGVREFVDAGMLPWYVAEPVLQLTEGLIHIAAVVVPFAFDLSFSVLLSCALESIVQHADSRVQPRLVYQSLHLARLIKQGPTGNGPDHNSGSSRGNNRGPSGNTGAAAGSAELPPDLEPRRLFPDGAEVVALARGVAVPAAGASLLDALYPASAGPGPPPSQAGRCSRGHQGAGLGPL